MRDKLKNEEEERARKEREMADKLKEQASASENEILTLHKRMAAENSKRIDEINELRYFYYDDFLHSKILKIKIKRNFLYQIKCQQLYLVLF